MAKIAIIVGHPRRNTLCEALARKYAQGAESAGHEVKLFVTGAMAFDPILHEGFERIQPLEPELASAHDAIFAADHMLLIFPLWLGDMPAILKGFLERVLQPDVIEPYKKGKFVKLLKGKTARIVITMGMPGFFYKLWFGAPALKVLRRAILHPMGVSPIRTTLLGRVDGVGDKGRQIWLTRLEQLGRRAA